MCVCTDVRSTHIRLYIYKPPPPAHTHTDAHKHSPELLWLLAGLNCFVVFLGLLFWALSWQATGGWEGGVYINLPLQLGTTQNTQWKHLCLTLSKHPAGSSDPLGVSKPVCGCQGPVPRSAVTGAFSTTFWPFLGPMSPNPVL